jgi:hypothetical protein
MDDWSNLFSVLSGACTLATVGVTLYNMGWLRGHGEGRK